MFQLTAARRRLEERDEAIETALGFNSQPPEGGWKVAQQVYRRCRFQLTAARRRLEIPIPIRMKSLTFQLTAARRRLDIAGRLRIFRLLPFQLTAARRRLAA